MVILIKPIDIGGSRIPRAIDARLRKDIDLYTEASHEWMPVWPKPVAPIYNMIENSVQILKLTLGIGRLHMDFMLTKILTKLPTVVRTANVKIMSLQAHLIGCTNLKITHILTKMQIAIMPKPIPQNTHRIGRILTGFAKLEVPPAGGGMIPITARTEFGIWVTSMASARWKTNGVMTVAFQKMRCEMLLMIKFVNLFITEFILFGSVVWRSRARR